MEEAHKAVLKGKRVHDDKIIPVPDEIRDRNTDQRTNDGRKNSLHLDDVSNSFSYKPF